MNRTPVHHTVNRAVMHRIIAVHRTAMSDAAMDDAVVNRTAHAMSRLG